jgi:flavin reductase (DIM6/NTAB) family NADH-FMN oxidoreductase RutF
MSASISSGSAVDPDSSIAYRRALGAFPTGVCVVTTEDGQGPLGLTINSFTSVSLEPPLVLWCLHNQSDRRHAFSAARYFAVNILAAEDQAHSQRFAGQAHRIDSAELDSAPGRAPFLKGALTRLECLTRKRMEIGDHTVLVGEVVAFDTRDGDALLFFRGRYGCASVGEM